MLDLQTLIFQFGLPGLPASFLIVFLLLSETSYPDVKIADRTLMTLALSLLLGYIIQQVWFLIFESTSLSYDSGNRKVLALLKNELINKKENSFLRKKWNIVDENDLDSDKLYAIWESILYLSHENNHNLQQATSKLRGIWKYFHSNMALILGLLIGIGIYCGFHNKYEFKAVGIWIPTVFFICIIFLGLKAWCSKKLVDELEKNWAQELIQKIEKESNKEQKS